MKMNIEELNEIMKKANLREIKKALKKAGFIDCKRNKRLRHVPLHLIAEAPYDKTLYFPDEKGNEYVGDLIHDVKGHEQYEFVIVQLLAPFKRGCEDLSTKKMLIFARDIHRISWDEIGNKPAIPHHEEARK